MKVAEFTHFCSSDYTFNEQKVQGGIEGNGAEGERPKIFSTRFFLSFNMVKPVFCTILILWQCRLENVIRFNISAHV